MAEPYKHIYKVDLNQQLVRRDVGLLATFDSKANRFGAELYRDGASVSASGYEVMGYFIRPDDETVNCPGTVEGNLVYVDLLPGCYLFDGAFDFTLKIKQGEEEKAVLMCYGNVVRSRTNATASGGDVIVTVTNAEMLGGKPPSYYLPAVQLLDNAYWKYPEKIINQRGIKSGDVIPTWAYFFDRWKSRSGQLTVTFDDNDGVIVNGLDGYFYQITERKYSGESYTAAVAFADGEILVCSGNDQSYAGSPILLATAGNVTGERVHIYRDTAERIETMFFTGSRRVLWLLLTPGTYTAATLPLVVPRPYAVELAECRRYYIDFGDAVFELPRSHNDNIDRYTLVLPQEMCMDNQTVLYDVVGDNGWFTVEHAKKSAITGYGTSESNKTCVTHVRVSADL